MSAANCSERLTACEVYRSMRKRRRLANKLTIFVCAVLCAVSAFFYAPMEVRASDSLSGSISYDISSFLNKTSFAGHILTNGPLIDDVVSDDLYEVDMNITGYFNSSQPVSLLGMVVAYQGHRYEPFAFWNVPTSGNVLSTEHLFNVSGKWYLTGAELNNFVSVYHCTISADANLDSLTCDVGFTYTVNSYKALSDADADDYLNGYNAGYADGESAGYGNGYSNGFADGEASVDTDAIYDEAFQAGKDSVDTQSYYDAGYQAGYNAAYSEGYESGYDVGYQSAMDRIENWGADTSDYPILVFDESVSQPSVYVDCMSNIPGTSYGATSLFHLDFNVNPNHTYKFVFDSEGFYNDTYNCLFSDRDLGYVVGNLRIPASYNSSWGTNTVFIPGDCVSSVVKLDAYVYEMRYYGGVNESNDLDLATGQVRFGTHGDVSLKVYDMGPSGDTQNHIANQTDQLTNGFDDSQGNTVNSDLSSGLNEYQTAEDSLWATATTGLKDFTFFDFESVPAMITGMSFITSIMGSWFSHAGGASGVGIVLSILFSVMLVAMVLGLYRLYQSKGGKN